MSPRPTARATSTSRFGSIVYDASPSTSDGAMPASSSAIEIAWHASESSVSGSPLPNVVCPMPTTAVWSLTSSLIAALTSPSTPACRRSRNDATPSPESTVRLLSSTSIASSSSRSRRESSRRVVQQLLRPADRLGRAAREPLGPLLRGRLQLGGGHDLVDDAERSASAAERSSPKKMSSLALCMPTTRGNRYATPPSGTRPRRTNTWMSFALSAAITRSAASTNIEPPPAAVPLSATMIGFSQSGIACISRWKPSRIMCDRAADHHRSGAPSGFGLPRAAAEPRGRRRCRSAARPRRSARSRARRGRRARPGSAAISRSRT